MKVIWTRPENVGKFTPKASLSLKARWQQNCGQTVGHLAENKSTQLNNKEAQQSRRESQSRRRRRLEKDRC